MGSQRKDAAIAKTSIEEVAKLEHACEDYQDGVECGDDLPETAEDD